MPLAWLEGFSSLHAQWRVWYIPAVKNWMSGVLRFSAVILLASVSSAFAASSREHRAIVLAIDASGSLKKTDPKDLRSEAARLFIDTSVDGDLIAVQSFSGSATELSSGFVAVSSDSRDALRSAISRVPRDGRFTDHASVLLAAKSLFQAHRDRLEARYQPTVLLFTDGKLDPDPALGSREEREADFRRIVGELRDAGVSVYVIALGSSDEALLRFAADETKGALLVANDPGQLLRQFWAVRQRFSNSYPVFQQIDVPTGTQFDLPPWATSAAIALFHRNRPGACVPTAVEAAKNACRALQGSSYTVFRCDDAPPLRWELKDCGADIVASVNADLHLALEVTPEDLVVGEPARVSASLRTPDGSAIYGLPFIQTAVVDAWIGENRITLFDDGASGDAKVGDGVFARTFVPGVAGNHSASASIRGETFELESTKYNQEVLAAPFDVALDPSEVECFFASSCTATVLIRNPLKHRAVSVSSADGALMAPAVLPPQAEIKSEARFSPPEEGARNFVVTWKGDGFVRPVSRGVVVRRLTLTGWLLANWFVSGPVLLLFVGVAFTAVRGPAKLAGGFSVSLRSGDGREVSLPAINLASRRTRRVTASQLGLPLGFAVESRRRGLWGSSPYLIPGGSPIQLERNGLSVSISVARPLVRGDRIRTAHEGNYYTLTYR